MYEEIVARGGVSPDYFFNEMELYECVAYLNGMRRKERAALERTRLIMWASLTPYSKNALELDDVLKLDDPQPIVEEENHNAMEEMKPLRKRAKLMEEMMNE